MALMPSSTLISPKTLARNTLINVISLSLPLLVGFFSMPLIMKGLGKERFGILSLAWVVLGYMVIFDLGLGRATTKYIASAISQKQEEKVSEIFWTTVISQFCLGLAGTVFLFLFTPYLTSHILRIPDNLFAEAKIAFRLLSFIFPLLLVSSSFFGVLEVQQRFDLINMVKAPLTSLNFLLAALAYWWPLRLPEIIGGLLIFRAIGVAWLLFFCFRQRPDFKKKFTFSPALFRLLFAFGGWLSVSNVAGPFLVYFERFLIGAWISMEAVAFYTAPYEVVTRLWILPTSLVLTLFPVFSMWAEDKKAILRDIFFQSLKYLFLVMGPVVLLGAMTSREILSLWLGNEFREQSHLVFQVLAWGVLINSLAQVPLALLQGMGRPDLPAKFHLIEIPVFAAMAWILVRQIGIIGAALAWTLRVGLDALFLFAAAVHRIPSALLALKKSKSLWLLFSFSCLTGACYLIKGEIVGGSIGLLVDILLISLFLYFSWRFLLDSEEKKFLLKSWSRSNPNRA